MRKEGCWEGVVEGVGGEVGLYLEIFSLTWCEVVVCYRESIDLSEYPCERYARALPVEQFGGGHTLVSPPSDKTLRRKEGMEGSSGGSFNFFPSCFRMKELIGFSTDDFIGTRLRDYFHPADYTKLIPCEVMRKSNTYSNNIRV